MKFNRSEAHSALLCEPVGRHVNLYCLGIGFKWLNAKLKDDEEDRTDTTARPSVAVRWLLDNDGVSVTQYDVQRVSPTKHSALRCQEGTIPGLLHIKAAVRKLNTTHSTASLSPPWTPAVYNFASFIHDERAPLDFKHFGNNSFNTPALQKKQFTRCNQVLPKQWGPGPLFWFVDIFPWAILFYL